LSGSGVEELRERLEAFNPWWSDRRWFERDPLVLEYERGSFRVVSRLYYHIRRKITAPGKYGIVTLRGPRRSGKTTVIKLVIRDLLEEFGIDPSAVFYLPMDYGGLRGVRLFDALFSIAGAGGGEKYVFLDEVSMCREWALELKSAFDAGIVSAGKLKIIASGSHSMDLAEAADKLRGRQGDLAREFNLGGNLLFTPLRFPEVVESVSEEVRRFLDARKFRRVNARFELLRSLSEGVIGEGLRELYDSYFATLNQMFENYLLHGGYPKAVKDFYEAGQVDKSFYADLAQLLVSDSRAAGLDADTLKVLLAELVRPERLSGVLSLASLRLRGVGRRELWEYLKYLISTWAFFLSYSESKGRACEPNYSDEEHLKLYVLDPFIFHALYSYVNNVPDPFGASKALIERPDFRGLLVESVVAAHLLLSQQLFEHVAHVSYDRVLMRGTREGGGREVDFVLCIRKGDREYRFLVESKYRERAFREASISKTIVLTKDLLDVDRRSGTAYVPTSVFLMLF